MASGDLNKEIKRISQLTQYKNASKATVEKVANINIWKRQIKIGDKFDKECDKKLAEKLFGDYLDNYEFDSFSDLNTLADLIFEEVLKFTLQTQINKTMSDETNKYIPEKSISSLHDVEEKVLKLKDMLGINKKDDQKDDLTALQMLQKRFDKYIEFNRNEFTMICGTCGSPTLLRRRVKDFDVLKHPFFCGRFYYNSRGMSLVKAGIWDKYQYAWVFHTHPDYVDWCIKHEGEIPDVENFTEEEIKEFISKNPYLRKDKIPENILKVVTSNVNI